MAFLHAVADIREEEKQREFRSTGVRVGDELPTPQAVQAQLDRRWRSAEAAALDRRQAQRQLFETQAQGPHDAPPVRVVCLAHHLPPSAAAPPQDSYSSTAPAAPLVGAGAAGAVGGTGGGAVPASAAAAGGGGSGESEEGVLARPTFDPYSNDDWRKRRLTLLRFVRAASKIIVRRRVSLRLAAIRARLASAGAHTRAAVRALVERDQRIAASAGAAASSSSSPAAAGSRAASAASATAGAGSGAGSGAGTGSGGGAAALTVSGIPANSSGAVARPRRHAFAQCVAHSSEMYAPQPSQSVRAFQHLQPFRLRSGEQSRLMGYQRLPPPLFPAYTTRELPTLRHGAPETATQRQRPLRSGAPEEASVRTARGGVVDEAPRVQPLPPSLAAATALTDSKRAAREAEAAAAAAAAAATDGGGGSSGKGSSAATAAAEAAAAATAATEAVEAAAAAVAPSVVEAWAQPFSAVEMPRQWRELSAKDRRDAAQLLRPPPLVRFFEPLEAVTEASPEAILQPRRRHYAPVETRGARERSAPGSLVLNTVDDVPTLATRWRQRLQPRPCLLDGDDLMTPVWNPVVPALLERALSEDELSDSESDTELDECVIPTFAMARSLFAVASTSSTQPGGADGDGGSGGVSQPLSAEGAGQEDENDTATEEEEEDEGEGDGDGDGDGDGGGNGDGDGDGDGDDTTLGALSHRSGGSSKSPTHHTASHTPGAAAGFSPRAQDGSGSGGGAPSAVGAEAAGFAANGHSPRAGGGGGGGADGHGESKAGGESAATAAAGGGEGGAAATAADAAAAAMAGGAAGGAGSGGGGSKRNRRKRRGPQLHTARQLHMLAVEAERLAERQQHAQKLPSRMAAANARVMHPEHKYDW